MALADLCSTQPYHTRHLRRGLLEGGDHCLARSVIAFADLHEAGPPGDSASLELPSGQAATEGRVCALQAPLVGFCGRLAKPVWRAQEAGRQEATTLDGRRHG